MTGPIDDAALDTIFRDARSYNGYLPGAVTQADCEAIWELMKWGPTSANQLPARLVWCLSDAAKRTLADCASGTNAPKIVAAPATVIVAMDTEFHEQLPWLFPHTDAKAWFDGNTELREVSAMRNSTLQGAYFIVAARALGWDTGPMSGFDAGKVEQAFFAGERNLRVNFLSTLGHGDPASVFGRLPRPEFGRFNRVA